jgi:glutamate N-acetyltransferase/amino-acid N-acetyltransferase
MSNWHLPRGFRYSGVHCGIRSDPERLDLALVLSDGPASAAGVFTQNQVVAAPVQVCRERLPRADARGIVICSGNANACTGEQGLNDARRMTETYGEIVRCRPEQILVSSTGVIGRMLPMAEVERGIRRAVEELGTEEQSLRDAAQAILTTDTKIKVSTRSGVLTGGEVCVMGFAKGAAMIGPNLATMLAFVLTDAAIPPGELALIAARSADTSFNCCTVEGHTSTNDTLLLFANGAAGPVASEELGRIEQLIAAVCTDLARAIVADAEGATHFITITVEGLRDDAEARRVAKTVAESALVKTAIFGNDPNWGRFVSAAGYSGVRFRENDLSLWLGDMLLYHRGAPQLFDGATASAYLKNNRDIELRLRFDLGSGRSTLWASDLTYDYVRLNAEYTT